MFIENKIKFKLSKPGTICGTQQQQQLYYTQYHHKNAHFLHVQAGIPEKTSTYCGSFGFVLPRIVSVVYCIHRDKYASSVLLSPPLIE